MHTDNRPSTSRLATKAEIMDKTLSLAGCFAGRISAVFATYGARQDLYWCCLDWPRLTHISVVVCIYEMHGIW